MKSAQSRQCNIEIYHDDDDVDVKLFNIVHSPPLIRHIFHLPYGGNIRVLTHGPSIKKNLRI